MLAGGVLGGVLGGLVLAYLAWRARRPCRTRGIRLRQRAAVQHSRREY
jgi:hypothetical protein